MDVILLERVEKLGRLGEVVSVKPGYARNYLLPRKKALRATKENLAYFESQRSGLEAASETARTEAILAAGRLEGVSCVIIRQAGENGQLYGSVSARDIVEKAGAAGVAIVRSQVQLDRPIKTLGLYRVRIALHPEVVDTLTVNVARSEEEAVRQARGEDVLAEPREEADAPEGAETQDAAEAEQTQAE